jgi:hypothetical protein
MVKKSKKEIEETLEAVAEVDLLPDKDGELKYTPPYIEMHGYVYERIDCDSEQVDFELDDDLVDHVNASWKKEGFVSAREYLRCIVREYCKTLKDVPEKTKKATKTKTRKSTKK